ncbi:Deleted in malignant brain tumors 1 protein [Trichoplax sp. H2]|nr:Deleted in malignant brain tumors 1 protein [Trichoplax sp. H2]|eukprot:RDD45649.1 Deleted in malignant brain tumors 1 protein [Trichoplax sp. H2]
MIIDCFKQSENNPIKYLVLQFVLRICPSGILTLIYYLKSYFILSQFASLTYAEIGRKTADISPTIQTCADKVCIQGACVTINGTQICLCYAGYSGENCQTDSNGRNSPCLSNPCRVGKCVSFATTAGPGYICSCPKGVHNQECYNAALNIPNQKCRGKCNDNPCSSGICFNYFSYSTYTCSCPSGKVGRNCSQIDTQLCSSLNPCQNGGTCTTYYNNKAYNCSCPYPYSGERCETTIACSSNPCRNNGTCISQGGGANYSCHCPFPYTGKTYCQYRIDSPCNGNPCMNRGICKAKENGFFCQCLFPFQGNRCQIRPEQNGDVRLIDSDRAGSGLAQVYYHGVWGGICLQLQHYYNLFVSNVICRQLGYFGVNMYHKYKSKAAETSPLIDHILCSGRESSILMCNYANIGNHSLECPNDDLIFVRCRPALSCSADKSALCAVENKICRRSQGLPSAGQCVCRYGYTGENCTIPIITQPLESSIRVYDWYNVSKASQINTAKGAIEIFHNGAWGAVCYQYSERIAVIACKQLGYTIGYRRSYCCDRRIPSLKVWVSSMRCFGNESKITDCLYRYKTDAAICSRYKVECINASCQPNPCLNNGNCSLNQTSVAGISAIAIQCQCIEGFYGDYCQYKNFCNPNPCQNRGICSLLDSISFSCKCTSSYLGKTCEKGPILNGTLVIVEGKPNDINVGRPQYFYNGLWRPICSTYFSLLDAHVVCQQAGFAGATSFTTGTAFGIPPTSSGMINMKCTGYESSIFDCPGSDPSRSSYCFHNFAGVYCSTIKPCSSNPCTNGGTCLPRFYGYYCKCTNQFKGKNCQLSSSPILGSVRLVNGTNPLSGRVEIYLHNNWAAVCLRKTSLNDMRVICKQLGYTFANAFPTPVFGQSASNAASYQLNCKGNENSVKDCAYRVLAVHGRDRCGHSFDLTLSCSGNTAKNGDLRLAGTSERKGIVQVYHNGTWGVLCRSGFSTTTYKKICLLLGFYGYYSAQGQRTTFFGYGPVMLHNVRCLGTEWKITGCNTGGWYNVPQYCQNHSQDLYISCYGGSNCGNTAVNLCSRINRYCKSNAFYRPTCYCKAGYTGSKCQTPIVPRADGTLALFATSNINHTVKGTPLVYHEGVWGAFCHDKITTTEANVICRQLDTPCKPNNCVHGQCRYNSSKVDGKTYYTQFCHCNPGYHGRLCQYKTSCDSEPCMNGGLCTNLFNYYKCQCLNNYYGIRCEHGPPKNGDANIIPEADSDGSFGRVEIFLQGSWQTVCHRNFSEGAANVICQQLGWAKANYISSYHSSATGKIGMVNVRCSGYEPSLTACQYDSSSAESVCDHSNDVAIICNQLLNPCSEITCSNGGTCKNMFYGYKCICTPFYSGILCENYIGPAIQGDIRLLNGANTTEGRVEIYHNKQWGTLCSKLITVNDGMVLCRQLNLTFSKFMPDAYFGKGSNTVVLSTNCSGNEPNVRICNIQPVNIEKSDCSHANDVSILCSTKLCQRSPCQNGGTCLADSTNYICRCKSPYTGKHCVSVSDLALRLVNYSRKTRILEIFHKNKWRAVCNYEFTYREAQVACRQLGFLGLKQRRWDGRYFGSYWLNSVTCNGSEARLANCNIKSFDNIKCRSNDVVGLECTADACSNNPCSSRGKCTLVNGDINVYSCVCIVGYTGQDCSSKIECNNNPCGNSATCLDHPYGYSCYCPQGFHGRFCTERATEGDVRLTSSQGNNVMAGTLQIYHNGTWGSVCDQNTFNNAAASLICSKLNYPYMANRYQRSFYGHVTGKIFYSGILCSGNETSILDCKLNTKISPSCDYFSLVGIQCADDPCYSSPCPRGTCTTKSPTTYQCNCEPEHTGKHCETVIHGKPLKLIGGPNKYTGNLAIFYNGTWGSVCDDYFDLKAADVACRQLGFTKVRKYYCCSRYNSNITKYWLDDVKCVGNESFLSNCQHRRWGYHNCINDEEAGVECEGNWCSANLCPSNATCFTASKGESYYCQCPNGYYGDNCQFVAVSNGAIRINGSSKFAGIGFVEIYQNGVWGTVCNIGLDLVDATVICRAAGFGNATTIYSSTIYGSGNGKILFDSLNCNGDEASPLDCLRNIPVNATCTHSMDATIRCSSHYCDIKNGTCNNRGTCVALAQDHEYICQCNKGYTGKNCEIDIDECASNPCQSMAGGLAVCKEFLGYYTCECPVGYSGYNCLFYSTVIGIRLTSSTSYNQGQVEIYNGQVWGKICTNFWHFQDAQVACRQLGFADTQLRSQCCGTSNMPTIIGKIDCLGNEPNLANCPQSNTTNDLSQCSATMSAQAFCIDVSACLSSPCGSYGATCIDILQPVVTFTCLCDSGYWNGNECVRDIALSQITLQANATTHLIGQQLSLQCMAYAYPLAKISWTKNGIPISADDNINFGTSSMSEFIAESALYFNPVVHENIGVYRCNGMDSKGKIVRSNSVTIQFTCSPEFCSNHGYCSMVNGSPSCSHCKSGFTGHYCESIMPTETITASHCLINLSDNNNLTTGIPLRFVVVRSDITTYKVGQYVRLDCEAPSYPLSSISWSKNNILIAVGNKYSVISIQGKEYYQVKSSLSFILQSPKDTGAYSCSATQPSTGKVVKSNIININIPLTNVTLQSNTSLHTFGSYIALTCQAKSRPNSTLIWTKNGVPIGGGGNINIIYKEGFSTPTTIQSILVISILTIDNNGDYRCVGNYKNSTIIVQSREYPALQNSAMVMEHVVRSLAAIYYNADLPLDLVTVKANATQFLIGSYAGLQCEARARPRPTFIWFQNGKRILLGSRIKMSLVPLDSNDTSIMILSISNLQLTDAGSYNCQVIDNVHMKRITSTAVNIQFSCSPAFCNSQGRCNQESSGPKCSCGPLYIGKNCETQLEMIPVGVESISTNTSTFKVGSYARLQCQAIGRPLPSLTWTKDEATLVTGNTSKIIEIVSQEKSRITSYLAFSPLSIRDSGVYSCRVKDPTNNHVLSSVPSRISFVCSEEYCSNNGQCNMQNNIPICSCSGGFGGDNCQSPITQTNGTIIGVAVGCIVGVLAVVGVFALLWRKRFIGTRCLALKRPTMNLGGKDLDMNVLISSLTEEYTSTEFCKED